MMVKHFPLSRPIFVQSTSCLCCLSCTDPIQPCSIPSGTATTVQTPPKPSAFALKTLISWELGVRSVWAPGMKFASLGTSLHFLGSWKPKGVSSLGGGRRGTGGRDMGLPSCSLSSRMWGCLGWSPFVESPTSSQHHFFTFSCVEEWGSIRLLL